MMIVASMLLLTHLPLRAQPSLPFATIGIMGGADLGIARTTFPVFAGSSDCGTFSDGSIVSGWIGATASFPSLFTPTFGLYSRIGWSISTARLTSSPIDPLVIFDGELHRSVTIPSEYRFTSTRHALRLDLATSIRLTDRWNAVVGPWADYTLSADFEQTDAITDGVHRFEGGSSERPMSDGTTLTAATLGGGIVAGIAYTMPLSGHLRLIPDLTIRADLSSQARETSWHGFTVGIGLGIGFELSGHDAIAHKNLMAERPPDSVSRAQPPPLVVPSDEVAPFDSAQHLPRLYAALNLYSIDSAQRKLPEATIDVTEIVQRERRPLGNTITVGSGTSASAALYRPLTQSEAARFTPDSVVGYSDDEFDRNRLNVLGYRLHREAGAELTMELSESAGANARSTAEKIREYLRTIWGIEGTRITVVTRDAATAGTDGIIPDSLQILLTSTPANLLAPVQAEQTLRTVAPPMISVKPSFRSSAGIASWKITLSQNGNVLGIYSSGTGSSDRLDWKIAGDETELAPLTATMIVEDSAGNSARVSTHIPLSIRRSSSLGYRIVEPNSAGERLLFTSSPARSSEEIRGFLDRVVANVKEGERIVLIEPTDVERPNRSTAPTEILRTLLEQRGLRNVAVTATPDADDLSGIPGDLIRSPEGIGAVIVRKVSTKK